MVYYVRVCIKVIQEDPIWIGFAVSKDALMAGSQAIIGTFNSDEDSSGIVNKYNLGGYYMPSIGAPSM